MLCVGTVGGVIMVGHHYVKPNRYLKLNMFTGKDIAEYYNTTQIHYKKWWNLNEGLSLHYGIWENDVKNFTDSLINTNKVLMNFSLF